MADDKLRDSDRDRQDTPADSDRTESYPVRTPEPDHLGAAERAFEESQGSERRSTGRGARKAS